MFLSCTKYITALYRRLLKIGKLPEITGRLTFSADGVTFLFIIFLIGEGFIFLQTKI
jgi:hypothetical protein